MDKMLRNVIIFVGLILVIATVAVVMAISGNAPDTNPKNTGSNNTTVVLGEHQDVTLSVSGGTYILTPSVLKKDVPVKMTVDLSTVRGCARSIVISSFGVRAYVGDGNNVITFTPTKTGTINIACSMNMYRGTFTVE